MQSFAGFSTPRILPVEVKAEDGPRSMNVNRGWIELIWTGAGVIRPGPPTEVFESDGDVGGDYFSGDNGF
jgi:hypothetical protein